MPTLIQDPEIGREIIDDRRARGVDRWDEVWEGTYIVMPLPSNQHQELVGDICHALKEVIRSAGLGRVFPGCNVSDRARNWTYNFRCPDVAAFLNTNPAIDHGTHWEGGPDLAVEIVSPDDRSHEKLDFYAAIGTRELLILDRDPWRLELYRAANGALVAVAGSESVATETVGVRWSLLDSPDGAVALQLAHDATGRRWSIAV
jgi:Uma2 family endonuclease